MQTESGNGQVEKLQTLFMQKYNEEITLDVLNDLTNQFGVERVSEVISKMKDGAYHPISYLRRCLNSGWYNGNEKPKSNGNNNRQNSSGKAELERTIRWIWNTRYEAKWIERDEKEYMLDILLNGTQPDEQKVQDIWFKVYMGQYPKNPASWFYWLEWPVNQQAANEWIERVGRSDLPLYDIPRREATIDELL